MLPLFSTRQRILQVP